MAKKPVDPFSLSAEQILAYLSKNRPLFPELEAARANSAALRSSPAARAVLEETEPRMADPAHIPLTTYTKASLFALTGDREQFEDPYFSKRGMLAGATLRLFFGQKELRDVVQDYIWNICEETTWVLPAHSRRSIDLFSAETAFNLAETLALLGDTLDAAIRARVRREIEQRIFQPYLEWYDAMEWYRAKMNWNGVCNSSVAATFLLLDPERQRAAKAVEIALKGLQVFIATAFEEDGASSEGVGYWHYGLHNFVPLAEMLRAASDGAVDLLAGERMHAIAQYPAKAMLSPGHYTCFADSHELSTFYPGMVVRLAERAGTPELRGILKGGSDHWYWRISMMLRDILWWDGSYQADVRVSDVFLPSGAVARMEAQTAQGTPVVAAIKGGNNGVPHNNNDIGSFMVHVGDESLLTDPGGGLYTRQYFSAERYQNIFCNSYGHGVPRIGGKLQPEGSEYYGEITMDASGPHKTAVVEFAHAYALPNLSGARRQLTVEAEGKQAGTVILQDDFTFSGKPEQVEEAFMTWAEVEVNGATAVVRGKKHSLRLTIESPSGAAFSLERLEKESKENEKPEILKRLTFVLPEAMTQQARVRMEVV